MNTITRRGFFEATAGALIVGPVLGPTVLRYHVPTRTIRKVREFPKETILEIDEEGRVHELDPGLQVKITEMIRDGDLAIVGPKG